MSWLSNHYCWCLSSRGLIGAPNVRASLSLESGSGVGTITENNPNQADENETCPGTIPSHGVKGRGLVKMKIFIGRLKLPSWAREVKAKDQSRNFYHLGGSLLLGNHLCLGWKPVNLTYTYVFFYL